MIDSTSATIIVIALSLSIATKILLLILNLFVWPYLNSREEGKPTRKKQP